MTVTEELAMRRNQSLAYAWGRMDATNQRTPTVQGSQGFSDAYVVAWAALVTGQANSLPALVSAYDAWQRSNGMTVYPELAR